MLLRLEGVSRSFGSRTLFRDVAITIQRDDRIGLVGPNGAGKTTLLHIAAGLEAPDLGRVTMPREDEKADRHAEHYENCQRRLLLQLGEVDFHQREQTEGDTQQGHRDFANPLEHQALLLLRFVRIA